MLRTRKTIQSTDIPIKILKQNVDIVGDYICLFFNKCIETGTFPYISKQANTAPIF